MNILLHGLLVFITGMLIAALIGGLAALRSVLSDLAEIEEVYWNGTEHIG